jgi:D-alanyl-D-alanine carboxypeptidase/D-alanyl-D-alanine-endopeptidase (penicillin-binding protein 4)
MSDKRVNHRTFRFALMAGLGLLCALAGHAPAGPPARAAAKSDVEKLDDIVSDHRQKGVQVGANVIDLSTGKVVYSRNAELPLMPASNMKLVVMAAALDQLGADYQFETIVGIRGKDLVIIGGGDPTLGDERLAQQRGEKITSVLLRWTDQLKKAGVKQIPGNIVVDDSLFDRQFVHPNWPADQFESWYEAPIGALNFNSNCLDVSVRPTTAKKAASVDSIPANTFVRVKNNTVTGGKHTASIRRTKGEDAVVVSGTVARADRLGPVTVRDPGLFTGSAFKTILASKGIALGGSVVRERVRNADGSLPAAFHKVVTHRTPLTAAMSRAGKDSLGMMAEALIKLLGSKKGGVGTWESGRAAVEAFLAKVKVSAGQFRVDDGSGLSRQNRLSAAAMTDVLRYTFSCPGGRFDAMRSALSRAGIDGTLEKRMRNSAAKGRVFAKTGYINGVRTLAGYVHTTSDKWLAFAFFYNQAPATRPISKAQDRACELLVQWRD